ncbi:Cell division protein FtsQ [compost metagenome]|uniref:cell division protein FtsQ/DivIB n=1 Tax=Pedobacter sp. ok626 TaxID=1761882 RepID=UPI00088B122D|nr:cell division protein FtsQ [Pedobacter sp. ok626]SDK44424.1 cell division protein FtsQ [Pedobacter sp. ok626]
MLKRINWKPIFKCFAWIVCLAGLVVLMSFVDGKKKKLVCTNVKILIPGADNFIEREEVDAILKQSQGALIGQNLAGINLQRIEKNIIANPYIAYATVYADMNGVIQIEIKQRQPILRVINSAGQDYYIDSNGLKMPVSPNFTANVLAANGDIMEHFSGKVDTLISKLAVDLYKVALYVKQDTLWDAQIEQLYVNNAKDIELIPRVGNHRIILGTADSLETKMTNLLAFYKKAIPKVGWNTYKTINVKYINQVVCEKNKIDSLTGEVIKDRGTDTAKQSRKLVDSVVRKQIATDIQSEGGSEKEKDKKIPGKTSNKLNKSI